MSTHYYNAIIWIDHHQAKIFNVEREGSEKLTLHPDVPLMHVHHKANTTGSGHETLDQAFLHEIATAVKSAEKILIVGPASAKTELVKHITHHDPKLKEKIVGVETVDHPSDKETVAFARQFFKTVGLMKPQ